MSTLSESYANMINPINTGAASSRPGGDRINISFTKGKKSNRELLEELQIALAKRSLQQQNATPVDAEAQRLQWEREDQALKAASDRRAAEQLALQQAQDARAAEAARYQNEAARYQNEAARMDIARARQQTPIQTESLKENLAGSKIQNTRARTAAAAEALKWQTEQDQYNNWVEVAKFNRNPLQYIQQRGTPNSKNPYTGKRVGTFEYNTNQTPQAVARQLQDAGNNVSPALWESAYRVLGPNITNALHTQYEFNKANPNNRKILYGF